MSLYKPRKLSSKSDFSSVIVINLLHSQREILLPLYSQTRGSYDFILQSFETYSDYMDYTMKERTSKTSVSFGFSIPNTFEFGFNYNSAKYSKSVKKILRVSGQVRLCVFFCPVHSTVHLNITKFAFQSWQDSNICHCHISFSSQSHSFVRAKAELELAQYMLKTDGLMLHPEFLQRMRSLPLSYVYGEYRQIFRDYGTHYITEAALGGIYDYTIILDKEKLKKSGKRSMFVTASCILSFQWQNHCSEISYYVINMQFLSVTKPALFF